MSKKKYNLKINYELYEVFDNYINEHIELGYRSVSEYLNELIRNKAKEILNQKKYYEQEETKRQKSRE